MTIDLPLCSDEVEEILRIATIKAGFKNPQITFHKGSNLGEGFLAIDTAVEVSENGKTLHLFVKTAPKHDQLRLAMNLRIAYCNEYRFYEKIYPKLEKFYLQKIGKSLEIAPRYYTGSAEELKEILVLENLKIGDFSVPGFKKVFDEEHVLTIFRTYAKLHATSLAFKDQCPNEFEEVLTGVQNFLGPVIQNHALFASVKENLKLVQSKLDPTEHDNIVKKIDEFMANIENVVPKADSFTGPHCVLTHGDCNPNNFMFRRKQGNLEMRLIDFQGVKMTSPAWDLAYSFYATAASPENLSKLDKYLDFYYENLASTLKQLGSDAEQLFPKYLIKEHWKIFSGIGLIMAIMMIAAAHVEAMPNIVDFVENPSTDATQQKMMIADKDSYTEKIKDLFQHYINNGLL